MGSQLVPRFGDAHLSQTVGGVVLSEGPAVLQAAVNETVSFCFRVEVLSGVWVAPRIEVTRLESATSVIEAEQVHIYRMRSVPISRLPGWHIRAVPPSERDGYAADVLIPLDAPHGGLPGVLTAEGPCWFWVDVAVPKGTFEGEYRGNIQLIADGKPVASLAVRLRVLPFMLPDDAGVAIVADVVPWRLFEQLVPSSAAGGRLWASAAGPASNPASGNWQSHAAEPELTEVLMETCVLLRAHGISPTVAALQPGVQLDGYGGVQIDWSHYDRVAEGLISGRAFADRMPHPGWPLPTGLVQAAEGARPGEGTGESGDGRERMVRDYAGQMLAHFEERGWLGRSYVEVGGDGVGVSERWLSAFTRGDHRAAVLLRATPHDLRELGCSRSGPGVRGEQVGIWMPGAQGFFPATMRKQREGGARTWVAADHPPYFSSSSIYSRAVDVRSMAWQARVLGVEVVHLGRVNDWPVDAGAVSPGACVAHDPHVLVYPGGFAGLDRALPSVRLKMVRRGMQDAAYQRLLEQYGLGSIVDSIRAGLVRYAGGEACQAHYDDGRPTGWSRDEELYELARRIMADALVRRTRSAGVESPYEELVRTVDWRQFQGATRSVKVSVEGVRMRAEDASPNAGLWMEVVVGIANYTRVPVSGDVELVGLPAGWRAEEASRGVEVPAGGERRRLVLRAGGAMVRPDGGGHLEFGLVWRSADGEKQYVPVAASLVTAAPSFGGIVVDGDLSEWLSGVMNVLGDFALIGSSASTGAEKNARRPRRDTRVVVVRGGSWLYVAVNCAAELGERAAQGGGNRLMHEQGIPVGEELVELLFDPWNSGSRSPGDLFHLAIKPSGAVLFEKGVSTDGCVGGGQSVPVGVEAHTRVYADRWVAEIAIPLSAFGEGSPRSGMWGFNVTRVDSVHEEYSTWSGAVGNAYDPLGLGNLFLPVWEGEGRVPGR